jgi:hypothetical protein
MDLMETPLGDEVQRIIDSKKGTPNVFLDATIHTLFGDVSVMRVLNLDVVREYLHQYSDEISLVVLVPAGQTAYRILPSRNQLEVTMLGSAMAQHGSTAASNQSYGAQRYRAVLKKANDAVLEAAGRELRDEATMDLQDFEVLEFQLFTKAMEQFSMMPVGDIYRRTTVGDLIRALLLQTSARIQVGSEYKPLGVDMVEPVDSTPREHIIIPHGTMAYDAPGYIHKHCGGVYSAGISYYYQDDYWYVFPPYDYKRFQEASRQLVIVQVPENKLPSAEHTYLVEGSVVNIIATGELTLDDTSDTNKRSTGNGVRFTDASKLFDTSVEVADNKAMMSRGKLNNEFVSSQQKSGLNNVIMSEERITSNTMYQASKLASKEGVHIQLVWQNADPSLIRPGMQTKIYYFKNGSVRQISAIVIGAHAMTNYEGTGLVAGRFSRNVALHLFAANEAQQ